MKSIPRGTLTKKDPMSACRKIGKAYTPTKEFPHGRHFNQRKDQMVLRLEINGRCYRFCEETEEPPEHLLTSCTLCVHTKSDQMPER